MVQNRLNDGKRIAQLLSSELTGDQRTLETVVVADADPDVEPTAEGGFAYRIVAVAADAVGTDDRGRPTLAADSLSDVDSDVAAVASVFVHPERARIEFDCWTAAAGEAVADSKLTVETADEKHIIFVDDGAEVKRVLPIIRAVVIDADTP